MPATVGRPDLKARAFTFGIYPSFLIDLNTFSLLFSETVRFPDNTHDTVAIDRVIRRIQSGISLLQIQSMYRYGGRFSVWAQTWSIITTTLCSRR